MATFPATLPNPNVGFDGELYLPQIRNEFEGNYVQSRPRSSRAIRRFALRWNVLTAAQFAILETFFLANQGSMFTYTDVIGTERTCRFSADFLKWQYYNSSYYINVECPLEEV